MSTAALRVSLGFLRLPDPQFDEYVGNVITSLTGNAQFATPPVTLADVTAAHNTFRSKLQALGQGGPLATAEKNQAREALEPLMRKLAGCVQITADDLPALLSSGFQPVNTSHVSEPVCAPIIMSVVNALSGQLVLNLQVPENAYAVEIHTSAAGGPLKHALTSTKSRKITLEGLTPGTVYGIQARALGSAGYGPWSNPISRMAI